FERRFGPGDETTSQRDTVKGRRTEQLAAVEFPRQYQLAVAPHLRLRALSVAIVDGDVVLTSPSVAPGGVGDRETGQVEEVRAVQAGDTVVPERAQPGRERCTDERSQWRDC